MNLLVLARLPENSAGRTTLAALLPRLAQRHRLRGWVFAPGPLPFPDLPGVQRLTEGPSRSERARAALDWARAEGVLSLGWPDPCPGLRLDDQLGGSSVVARLARGLGATGDALPHFWDGGERRGGPKLPLATDLKLRAPRVRGPALQLLFLSSRTPEHGAHAVIEAISGSTEHVRDRVRLRLCGHPGDAPYEANLERRARGAPVTLQGPCPPDGLLGEADVVVLPAHHRARWGLVALEAVAAGVPVIHGHCPVIDPIVGEAGLALPAGDVRALAGAIRELVHDDAALKAMEQRARAAASRVPRWDDVLPDWEQALFGGGARQARS